MKKMLRVIGIVFLVLSVLFTLSAVSVWGYTQSHIVVIVGVIAVLITIIGGIVCTPTYLE